MQFELRGGDSAGGNRTSARGVLDAGYAIDAVRQGDIIESVTDRRRTLFTDLRVQSVARRPDGYAQVDMALHAADVAVRRLAAHVGGTGGGDSAGGNRDIEHGAYWMLAAIDAVRQGDIIRKCNGPPRPYTFHRPTGPECSAATGRLRTS